MCGAGPVGVARLPLVPELGDGPLLAGRDEDRVIAESLRASRLLAAGAEQHELADVTRGPVLDAAQLAEQPLDRLAALRAVAGRADPRRAAKSLDLEPRVLAEHPGVRPELAPVCRLGPCVLDVAVASLVRISVGVQRLQRPVQQRRELPQLVGIP